jgi:type IV fimbrial biogenesis protein FimT
MDAVSQSGGRTCRYAKPHSKGFTVIEAIVAMAIAAILLTVAIPSFRDYTAGQRAMSLANALLVDINLARSEALRRAGEVRMAPLGSAWTQGWRVEEDGASDVIAQRDALQSASLTLLGSASAIVFDPFGAVASPSGGVELRVCVGESGTRQAGRRVVISPSGHAEVRKPADASSPCA